MIAHGTAARAQARLREMLRAHVLTGPGTHRTVEANSIRMHVAEQGRSRWC